MSKPDAPKRPRGRPRTRPLPDPSVPKRPPGRPAGTGRYGVTLAAIRVTEEERDQLRQASSDLGISVSELVRVGALRYAADLRRDRARIEAARY